MIYFTIVTRYISKLSKKVIKMKITKINFIIVNNFITYIDYLIAHKSPKGKERDLTQSYDESPFTNIKFNNQFTSLKRHQKLRLHKDCWPT